MKLIFVGTGTFAIPALEALADHTCLVVCQPARPSGRGLKLQPSPMQLAAERLDIAVEAPEKARDAAFVELIRALEADAMVVASYGQILSQKLLDSTRCGGINLHGSILPKYRGAAPIQRAILDREYETGITLMQMDRGMDTGEMISIRTTPIGFDETYGELQDRLALLAAEMAAEWMPRITRGEYERHPQDSAQATMAPKVEKAEAELNVKRDALAEYARFRAFTPSPGGFIQTAGGLVRISSARFDPAVGEPGLILATSPHLRIAFTNGALDLVEIQPEGKKKMSGRDFANGARLRPGMRWVL